MSKARELSQLGDKINIDDTTGDFAVDTDTLYVDVSANSVGIGTDTPSPVGSRSTLNVSSSDGAAIRLSDDTANMFMDYTDVSGGRISVNANEPLSFRTNSLERMIIDASGNLLVGKSDTTAGVAGVELRETGLIKGTVSNSDVAIFRRLSTDGDIVKLQKDGTTVGSIASVSGGGQTDIVIGSDATALWFGTGTSLADSIVPASVTSGGTRPDAISLGHANAKFKDLYLSGGVYLGGTGAANYLDDYEEGTWTIDNNGDSTGVIASNQEATYTKIGNQVTVHAVFQMSTSFTGNQIAGLPFLPYNPVNIISSVHAAGVMYYSSSFSFFRISHNSDVISFYNQDGTNLAPSTTNDPFRFAITYLTNS